MKWKLSTALAIVATFSLSAQTADIKLMTYNLMYYKASSAPCSHTRSSSDREQDLKTVVQYVQPDILVVNELGENPVNPPLLLQNVLNVDGTSHFDQANTTNNSFSSIVNMLFYNKEKLTLHSQSTLERDLNNFPLVRVIDFYRLYVNDAGLGQPGVDTVFFTVVSAHFKAGSSSSDKTQRFNASEAVMDKIFNEVGDDNVILAGDFNMRSSSEAAYQEMVNFNVMSAALHDPLNRPGSWNNNSSFASIHSQSTHSSGSGCFAGGGMDDRFDIILVSDEILNGDDNLQYNNYRTVGQDGGAFNGNLNTTNNVSVNANVANALYHFSDHLPITIDLEAVVSGIGISEYARWTQAMQVVNPFSEELEVRFKNIKASQPMSLKVIDLTGRTVAQRRIEKGATPGRLTFDSNGWSPGVYLIHLTDNHGLSITRKLVKN